MHHHAVQVILVVLGLASACAIEALNSIILLSVKGTIRPGCCNQRRRRKTATEGEGAAHAVRV